MYGAHSYICLGPQFIKSAPAHISTLPLVSVNIKPQNNYLNMTSACLCYAEFTLHDFQSHRITDVFTLHDILG